MKSVTNTSMMKIRNLVKKYRKQFQSIYSSIHSLSGDALVTKLQQLINLDNYFHFIAFNYLIMNGDYEDEVFLYIEPKNQRFEVIPWDYDDILKPSPHEGREERNRRYPDKKLFSWKNHWTLPSPATTNCIPSMNNR